MAAEIMPEAPRKRTSDMTASSAQICRDMGWVVGTVLQDVATKTRIEITAIGVCEILAVMVHDRLGREVSNLYECEWILHHRDWVAV